MLSIFYIVFSLFNSFPSYKFESQKWQETIFHLNNQNCNTVSKHSKICELHFHSSDVKRNGSRCVLKKGAEPKLFPNNKPSEQIEWPIEWLSDEFMDIDPAIIYYLFFGFRVYLSSRLTTFRSVPFHFATIQNFYNQATVRRRSKHT